VRAWAQAVYATGALPFYSIAWENSASRAVMRKLDVASFGTDLHIT